MTGRGKGGKGLGKGGAKRHRKIAGPVAQHQHHALRLLTYLKTKSTKPLLTKIKTSRIPPIFVQTGAIYPWRKIAKTLFTIQGLDQVTAKTTSVPLQIQINCPEESSFRLVQQFMTTNKINFHIFALPEEQSLKIVIKGVPLDVTDEELMDELQEIGFKPNFVRAFAKNDKRLPIHMVSLKRTENVKEIFETTELFYARVKIESYKSTGPAQCFSCQRFGHSSLQCGHPPRCVKCEENHHSKECKKSKEESPTCCNCNGKHTANYRGCPYYTNTCKEKTDHSKDVRTKFIQKSIPPTHIPASTLHETTEEIKTKSYASATKHQTEKTEPIIDTSKLLRKIGDLLTTAQKCEDVASKNAVITTVQKMNKNEQ
ncbi:hypothetical protein QTP88_005722 [Uroleucon formosanum]